MTASKYSLRGRLLSSIVTAGLCVFGGELFAQDSINVAIFGFAEQSTTGFGGEASRAIDGNTNGVYGGNSVTHTDPADPTPWWQVDLNDSLPVERIVLWDRTDACCTQRLQNLRVSVLDDGLDEVWGEDFFTDLAGSPEPDFGIDLPADTEGQFVRVELLGPNIDGEMILSLAEVEVFGSAEGLAPVITEQPVGGRIEVGTEFTLSVGAVGSQPLSYQWTKDGGDIDGATDATYTIDSAGFVDTGFYQVVVSNAEGDALSDEVEVVVTQVNLARGAIAIQSTTGFGGEASRGVDGNTSGVYNQGSVTHTATGDASPWWEVTLNGTAIIDTIAIWNRSDCCSERLTNFRVLVLDADRAEVFSEDFFVDGFEFPDPFLGPHEVEVDGAEGSVVRIERLGTPEDFPGQFFLSLAEVEVFGEGEPPPPPPPNPNLAAREEATTSQSSQLGGFGPELAVDGNLGNFTHTLSGEGPATWEVDLGDVHELATIRLHNRTSCCGSRLRDITVFVLDGPGGEIVFESELLNPENELGAFPLGPGMLELDLVALTGGVVSGQVVQVVREPDEDLSGSDGQGNDDEAWVLSLGEVEVFGPVDCPDEGDTHCDGLEVTPPDDSPIGTYVLMATGSDDSGDAPLSYTFRAEGPGGSFAAGPQFANQAQFNLGVGEWTLSVTVDDDPQFCDDEAGDATCTEVIVVEGDPNNLALGKPATQSTTGFGGVPGRAVDGNTSGVYPEGSVTHTAVGDPTPWWEVDLLSTTEVETITIWNRTDCCVERLTNFRVSLLDANRDEVFSEDFFTDGFEFPDTAVEGFVVEVDGAEGSIVRIERLGFPEDFPDQFFLSLAEVEVSGEEGPPDPVGGFFRGDADNSGAVNITDGIFVLNFLFLGGPDPSCMDAADADDSGATNITDGNLHPELPIPRRAGPGGSGASGGRRDVRAGPGGRREPRLHDLQSLRVRED